MKVLDVLNQSQHHHQKQLLGRGVLSTPNCRGLNSLPLMLGGWNQFTALTFPFIRAFQDIFLMFCDTRNADCVIWSSWRCYSMVFTYPITCWWLGIVTKNSSKFGLLGGSFQHSTRLCCRVISNNPQYNILHRPSIFVYTIGLWYILFTFYMFIFIAHT